MGEIERGEFDRGEFERGGFELGKNRPRYRGWAAAKISKKIIIGSIETFLIMGIKEVNLNKNKNVKTNIGE